MHQGVNIFAKWSECMVSPSVIVGEKARLIVIFWDVQKRG